MFQPIPKGMCITSIDMRFFGYQESTVVLIDKSLDSDMIVAFLVGKLVAGKEKNAQATIVVTIKKG